MYFKKVDHNNHKITKNFIEIPFFIKKLRFFSIVLKKYLFQGTCPV